MRQVIRVTQQLVLVFLVIPVLGRCLEVVFRAILVLERIHLIVLNLEPAVWNLSRAGVAVWSRRS